MSRGKPFKAEQIVHKLCEADVETDGGNLNVSFVSPDT